MTTSEIDEIHEWVSSLPLTGSGDDLERALIRAARVDATATDQRIGVVAASIVANNAGAWSSGNVPWFPEPPEVLLVPGACMRLLPLAEATLDALASAPAPAADIVAATRRVRPALQTAAQWLAPRPHRWFCLIDKAAIDYFEVDQGGWVLREVNLRAGQFVRASSWIEAARSVDQQRAVEYDALSGGLGDQPVSSWDPVEEWPTQQALFEAIWANARTAMGLPIGLEVFARPSEGDVGAPA